MARLAKMAEKSGLSFSFDTNNNNVLSTELAQYFDVFRVDLALQYIWSKLSDLDKHINENAPWGIEDNKKLQEILNYEVSELVLTAKLCIPFIPATAEKIINIFSEGKVTAVSGLFPRI